MLSLLYLLIVSGLTGSGEANNLSVSQGSSCWGPILNNKYLFLYPDGYSFKQTLTLEGAQAECLTLPTCGGVTSKPSSGYWECRKGSTPMTSSSGEKSVVRQNNPGCSGDPCASLSCGSWEKCKLSSNGPFCQACNDACPAPSGDETICASNGKTYESQCFFDIDQCWSDIPIAVVSQGPCGAPTGCWGPLRPNTYLYLYPDGYSFSQTLTLEQAQAECLSLPTCGGVTSKPNSGFWECRQGNTPSNSIYGESSYVLQNIAGCAPVPTGAIGLVEGATVDNSVLQP